MNDLNNSDEVVECPICMEPFEVDDLSCFPCTCRYQRICSICWHRIRTDEDQLCPRCLKEYPENPPDFKQGRKVEKRKRDEQRKQKNIENIKHLADIRVVQKNVVYVVGLPPRLADAEILKKHEFFGKYGEIIKISIKPINTYAGKDGPSASAYVTYVHNNDALRAIQNVNNIMIDGRLLKTSLGATKYCGSFLKNKQCPNAHCMFLHEFGDSEASFTNEQIQKRNSQEYEKRLHEALKAANSAVPGTVEYNQAWPSISAPLPQVKKGKISENYNSNNINNNGIGIANGTANNHQSGLKENSSSMNRKMKMSAVREKDSSKSHQHQQQSYSNQQIDVGDEVEFIEDDFEKTSNLSEDNDAKDTGILPLSYHFSSSSSSNNGDNSSLIESATGKSSPDSFQDHMGTSASTSLYDPQSCLIMSAKANKGTNSTLTTNVKLADMMNINEETKVDTDHLTPPSNKERVIIDTSACLSKLSLFDDNSSSFSCPSFSQLDSDYQATLNNQMNNSISSRLPDLNYGIDGCLNQSGSLAMNSSIDNPDKYLLSSNGTVDWEDAFKHVMGTNNKIIDEHHAEYLQKMQKINDVTNSTGGVPQTSGLNDFNTNGFHNDTDINRISQAAMYQQQPPYNIYQGGHMLTDNMPDPQKQINEHNRIKSQYLDHSSTLVGQNFQKQGLLSKYDQMGSNMYKWDMYSVNSSQPQPNRTPNRCLVDELGFDPIIEAKKGLAELMERENVQHKIQNGPNKLFDNSQRGHSHMPPPGFNHKNAFGCGVPRATGNQILPFMNMANNSNQLNLHQNNWMQQQHPFVHQPSTVHLDQTQTASQRNMPAYGSMPAWNAMDPSHHHRQQQQQYTTPACRICEILQELITAGYDHQGANLHNILQNYSPQVIANVQGMLEYLKHRQLL